MPFRRFLVVLDHTFTVIVNVTKKKLCICVSLVSGYPVPIPGFLIIMGIQHFLRYTELSPTRFKNFWRSEPRSIGMTGATQSVRICRRCCRLFPCPLYPRKRTCAVRQTMSALAKSGYRPLHSTTSPERAWSVAGISICCFSPVFRLITSSKVAGCTTGSSAGLAPLRIFRCPPGDKNWGCSCRLYG